MLRTGKLDITELKWAAVKATISSVAIGAAVWLGAVATSSGPLLQNWREEGLLLLVFLGACTGLFGILGLAGFLISTNSQRLLLRDDNEHQRRE